MKPQSKDAIPKKVQFFAGPKDGEIALNFTELVAVIYYEQHDSSRKITEPDRSSGDRVHLFHKYELATKPNGELYYVYRGIY